MTKRGLGWSFFSTLHDISALRKFFLLPSLVFVDITTILVMYVMTWLLIVYELTSEHWLPLDTTRTKFLTDLASFSQAISCVPCTEATNSCMYHVQKVAEKELIFAGTLSKGSSSELSLHLGIILETKTETVLLLFPEPLLLSPRRHR